jgi:hypothetical protein
MALMRFGSGVRFLCCNIVESSHAFSAGSHCFCNLLWADVMLYFSLMVSLLKACEVWRTSEAFYTRNQNPNPNLCMKVDVGQIQDRFGFAP